MKIGQGRDNARRYLKDNPDFCAAVEEQIRQTVKPNRENVVVEMSENAEMDSENFVKSDEN